MIRFWLLACCIVPALVSGTGCSSQTSQAQKQGLPLKPMPTELAARTKDETARFAKGHPLTAAQQAAVRDAVSRINPKGSTMRNDLAIATEIRGFGPGAIPVLANLLESPDDSLRAKAALGLNYFVRPRERIGANYQPIESLLILLFRRSVLDRNVEVRKEAVAVLRAIGKARFPSIPDGVKAGLEEAATSDPNLGVRELGPGLRRGSRAGSPEPEEKGDCGLMAIAFGGRCCTARPPQASAQQKGVPNLPGTPFFLKRPLPYAILSFVPRCKPARRGAATGGRRSCISCKAHRQPCHPPRPRS